MNRNDKVRMYIDDLYTLNYKERPVDILEFISNPIFLGKSTNNGKSVYDIWKKSLKKIFLDDSKFLVVFTGSIGCGKTFNAYIATAYVLYRTMCLKDPWGYFNLADSGKMNVTFFNLTKNLSGSKGFATLQSFLLRSEWFLSHGGVIKGPEDNRHVDLPLFSYSLASPLSRGFGNIGENVLVAVMDEIDSPTDTENMKKKVLKAYESTVRRFESRFVIDGNTLARFFLVASKQDEMSFLETFVEEYKTSNKIFVVDIPLWEAKPASNYSGEKFGVIIGDAYNKSRIINPDDDVKDIVMQGNKIIEVPVEYRDYFERDLDGCFTGDTRIPLLNGEEIQIKDMTGKGSFDVYSCRLDGRIVPGVAHSARLTRKNAAIIEIELDNHEIIRCTEDHLFLLKNGQYKKAKNLTNEDSLMPLYRKYNKKGYELSFDNRYSRFVPTHVLTARSGSKKGMHIHHKDFNHRNNSPSNLQQITKEQHMKIHAYNPTEKQKEIRDKNWKIYQEKCRLRNINDNVSRWPGVVEKSINTQRKRKTGFFKPGIHEKSTETRKKIFRSENPPDWVDEHKRRSSKQFVDYNTSQTKKVRLKKLNAEKKIGFSLRTEKQIYVQKNNAKKIRFSKKCPYCGKLLENVVLNQWGTHLNSCKHPRKINHRILTIKRAGTEDVYDITVDKYNNFALSAGVFVHNSLRDIAGVNIRGIRKSKLFSSENILRQCFKEHLQDCVRTFNIEIGLKDEIDLIHFFDFSKITEPKSTNRYIHCDIAFSGDALGLACSYIAGWKQIAVQKEDGTNEFQTAPIVRTEWALRIKARAGDSIPIHKIRKLILDLSLRGFIIKKFTSDLKLASEDTIQLLNKSGIDAGYFSVDKSLEPYFCFRDLVYEDRWEMQPCEFLFFELKNLELDRNKGKVDHPDKVKEVKFLEDGNLQDFVLEGSKDIADAVSGSVAQVIMNSKGEIDSTQALKILKKINDSGDIKDIDKDPFWFINTSRKEEEKIVSSQGVLNDDAKIQLLRKMRHG